MRKLVPAFLFALLASLGVASAQTPAQINTLNIAVTPTCGEQSLSNWAGKPFYLLYEDYTGTLCTTSGGGGGGGGTSATYGGAFPAVGTPAGGTDGTNFEPLTVDPTTHYLDTDTKAWGGTTLGAASNYGTPPGAVAVPGVNAYVTNSVTVTATDLSTNLAQVGGAAVALGQTTMSASMPVAIASNQSSLGVALNTTPSLANGNGVVPTQGGSVLSVSNGLPMQAVSQYPLSSTPITASAIGTTAATTATLAATSGKTTYICTMSIRANATAAATGNATVTGTITGTLNYTQWTAPLASGLGVTEELFMPCVPASGTNTSIAVVSAAPGSGGTVSVTVSGYQQ